jgi:anti-sigma factor RsiW
MPMHEAFSEDLAAHALGALTDEESSALRAHLEDCGRCRREVARLQAVTGALGRGVPPVAAPPELRRRVLDVVGSEARLFAAASTAPPRAPRRRRLALRPAYGLAAGAALALGIVLGALVIAPGSSTPRSRVIAAAVAPAARWGARRAPVATLHESGAGAQLVVSRMPAAPPGKVYEVWIEHGTRVEPTDALFSPSSKGNATVAVPLGLRGASAVLVTAERAGGVQVPTMEPLITASLG